MSTPWRPKPQPAPKVVSSGTESKKITPKWRPRPQSAPKVVRNPEPPTS